MAGVTIKIEGLEQLKKLGDISMKRAIKDILMIAGAKATAKAKSKAPVLTHALKHAIQQANFPTKVEVGVLSKIKYANMQEHGGTIVPRNKKFLVFQKGGKTIFAKKVTIPAHPYMRPTYEYMKNGELQKIVKKVINAEVAKAKT